MTSRDDSNNLFLNDLPPAISALTKLLLKCNLISEKQTSSTFQYQNLLPIAYFASCGIYDEWVGIQKIAEELGIEFTKIDKKTELESLSLLDKEPFSKLDLHHLSQVRVLPLKESKSDVTVAVANPLDFEAIKGLEFDVAKKVKVILSSEKQIIGIINKKLEGKDGLDFNTLIQSSNINAPKIKNLSLEPGSLESTVGPQEITAPVVVRLVNKIFSGAIHENASDIHINPEPAHLSVRIRVDGIMRDLIIIPNNLKDAVISRIKVLCGMDISVKRTPQDGRLRLRTSAGNRDLRVSTVPTVHGEDVVARVLASELKDISFETLGMPQSIRESFFTLLSGSSKVHVIAGPTGSGKTSSLYASLLHLRDGTRRIITIEDPIEYRIQGISQIQVNTKTGMTFDSALRSVLRQDPDIIMVGEIRDSETASTAMQVAQTGHLVLTTLHTNSAPAAITRLRDLGVPPFLIASSVGSVTAQRLIRRVCLHCKGKLNETHTARCKELGLDPNLFVQGNGCEECGNTGFRGRIGIYSFLEITPSIVSAIRDEIGENEIEIIARENGYERLDEAALRLAHDHITSIDEIERVLGHLNAFPQKTSANNIGYGSSLISPEAQTKRNPTEIHKSKILIVEDDESVRFMYKTLLEHEMFDVIQAENGLEGLKSVYENSPELIILDVMMPKMNGFEMLEKLRSNPKTKNIPVLMLTAVDTEENELKLMRNGADDFVSKASKGDIIVARIHRLLSRSLS